LDSITEIAEARDEASGLSGFGPAVEVIGAEIVVDGAVREHVCSGQDRGGYGADGFLASTAGAQPVELCLKIAALFAGAGPGTLDQGRLEPRRPLAHPSGAPLSGACVVFWTEMPLDREAARVVANLGHDDPGAEVAAPRIVVRMVIAVRKGSTLVSTSRIDLGNRRVDGVDLLEVQLQQEAVVVGHPAAHGLAKCLRRRLDPAMRQPGQCVEIAFTGNQGFDNRTPAQTHDIGEG
jgi:hypothetical protein